eukprot:gnl/MRDRNA2_/MRDRNA2_106445_c0_seq1.p1 gnl/MRDRNA2_/MRDRNA2_106445_c0~~gnl/MRDRNA2_/MRDRNA2_106445_c0_seq1.p1  ORF type:complete len:317 (-),score=54.16 gnl/MRDRNA2_/MRDRNA2_106445_c0_seq1:49-999(-)
MTFAMQAAAIYQDDDKHAKANLAKDWNTGLNFSFLFPRHDDQKKAALSDPFVMYTFFLFIFAATYRLAGHSFNIATYEDQIGYISCLLEGYGLVSVYRKIKNNKSAAGISGMTMLMFGLSYVLRECETMITLTMSRLTFDGAALEILQLQSVPLVALILWNVFMTHYNSYQGDLDVLKVKYLVPGCVVLALVLHPSFKQGLLYSLCWTTSFYVDVLALLPQVVMMSRGNGKVKAPIANFVATTSFSRFVDLFFWYFRFDLGPQGWMFGINYSGYLIVFWHIVSLCLVADFMYYYLRAKFAGSLCGVSEDVDLELEV